MRGRGYGGMVLEVDFASEIEAVMERGGGGGGGGRGGRARVSQRDRARFHD